MSWAVHIKCVNKRYQEFLGGGNTLEKQTAWKTQTRMGR